jgi:dephospho-CoA kinase
MVLDVDKLAKDIYLKKPVVINKLRDIFGEDILDSSGVMDFNSLGKKVFSDRKELEKLNSLMFPLIREEVRTAINKNQDKDYIVIDAAVLFDCKLSLLCDRIVLVETSDENRRRFFKNKNLLSDDIKLRIEGQHIKIDRERVDFFIDNNGSKDSLFKKVKDILASL